LGILCNEWGGKREKRPETPNFLKRKRKKSVNRLKIANQRGPTLLLMKEKEKERNWRFDTAGRKRTKHPIVGDLKLATDHLGTKKRKKSAASLPLGGGREEEERPHEWSDEQ